MRKSLTHTINGITRFVADFAKSLGGDVVIESGSWSLDRQQEMIAAQSVDGRRAVVELSGGDPGCQYVLIFNGSASDGTPLHAEYWLNTIRQSVAAPASVEPEISAEPLANE